VGHVVLQLLLQGVQGHSWGVGVSFIHRGCFDLTLLLLECCALNDSGDGRARDLCSSGACDDAAAC
jgi:hypothetical protein